MKIHRPFYEWQRNAYAQATPLMMIIQGVYVGGGRALHAFTIFTILPYGMVVSITLAHISHLLHV